VSDSGGAFWFGLVIGWVTYRTLRRSGTTKIGDIATVIGAVGGAAVTGLFPKESNAFGNYCGGLAIGFFAYLAVALILAAFSKNLSAVNEWLGDDPPRADARDATQDGLPGIH
jgi:hypothetical protein